jgi:MbtH protein
VIEDDEDDSRSYLVVCNSEEQYSIWPSHKPIPRGWRSVGKEARKAECLSHIEGVWTDMRPRSLREHVKTTENLRDDSESTES